MVIVKQPMCACTCHLWFLEGVCRIQQDLDFGFKHKQTNLKWSYHGGLVEMTRFVTHIHYNSEFPPVFVSSEAGLCLKGQKGKTKQSFKASTDPQTCHSDLLWLKSCCFDYYYGHLRLTRSVSVSFTWLYFGNNCCGLAHLQRTEFFYNNITTYYLFVHFFGGVFGNPHLAKSQLPINVFFILFYGWFIPVLGLPCSPVLKLNFSLSL